MSYAERLTRALDHAGKSRAELARAIGVSPQAIGGLMSGATKALTAENNFKAARALGVSAYWLATGEGTESDGDSAGPEGWPFRRIDHAKVKALSPARLAELETAVLIAAGHLGLDVRGPDDQR